LWSVAGCGRSRSCWMWCGGCDRDRHLAVNTGVQGRTADSGAIRSARVPKLKARPGPRRVLAQRPAAAQNCAPSPRSSRGEGRGEGLYRRVLNPRLSAVPCPSPEIPASREFRPLPAKRGERLVHVRASGRDLINGNFAGLRNAAAASRPRWPRRWRRTRDCAMSHRQSGRRTATDKCRCGPRTAPGPAGPAADRPRH